MEWERKDISISQRSVRTNIFGTLADNHPHPFSLQLLHPFQHRFTSLIHRPDFQTKFQDVELQQELLAILEALCGVALCGLTQVVWLDMAPEYFNFLLPLLQACVPLLELFADISEVVRVIFDLFCLVAEGYLCILDEVSIVNVMSCDVRISL